MPPRRSLASRCSTWTYWTWDSAHKTGRRKLIRTHRALPLFKRGKRLFLGVSDPTNLHGLDEIKFHTGLATEAVVVEEKKLTQASTGDAGLRYQYVRSVGYRSGQSWTSPSMTEERPDDGDMDIDEAPVVRFVNKVLLDAINSGASDIHFEPYEKISGCASGRTACCGRSPLRRSTWPAAWSPALR